MLGLISRNLFIAVVYYLFGRMGMMMSADPVMATLFWPGAGVLMAALYLGGISLLPGVYLGAAVLNFSAVYMHGTNVFNEATVLRIFLMGFPPTLQALTGAFLVRRFLGLQNRLETLKEVGLFSILAGPLNCLVSATLASIILYNYGLVSLEALPLSWTTWYVGDMLGVLVFAPVCVMFFNSGISRRRKVMVTVPLISIFALVMFAFFYAIANEKSARMRGLKTDSHLISQTLRNELDEFVQQLVSVRSFFYASDFVSEEEFSFFLKEAFSESPSMLGVYWAPRVLRSDLRKIEGDESKRRGTPYRIVEFGKLGEWRRAGERENYYPVQYAVRRDGIRDAIGFDFGSLEGVKRALGTGAGKDVRSFLEGAIFGSGQGRKLVLFLPVHNLPGVQRSQGMPGGFILGVFDMDTMVENIMKMWVEKNISLSLIVGEEAEHMALEGLKGAEQKKVRGSLSYLVPFSLADERWILFFSHTHSFAEARVNWGMWYVLAGSFLFTWLASGFLLIVTGHGAATEAVVREKTLQLQDQTGFLKVIMDNVPDMLFVKNERHEIVAANRSFLNLYSEDDQKTIIGRTGLEIFTPDEREIFRQQDRLAFSKGYTEVFESNTDYLGVQRTFFTRKIRFQDAEGRYLLLGIARDVSEILTAQAHLETIFMATADGLLVIEESGVVTTFNKACEQIFGYTREEVVGRSVSLLEPEIQAMEKGENFYHCITSSGLPGERKRYELWGRHKSGSVFPIYLAASQVNVGHVSFYCAIVRDISVEKKAQEDLRRSNQELEDFAYVASHDLKAPLRHLSLSSNFLVRNYSDLIDEKGRELLGIVRKSSERMFEMIDSLLAYSSVGRKEVEMSRISLDHVIDEVIEGVRSQIENSGARIVRDALPEVYGNKALMIQLFQNLIENAIKYRRKQSVVHIKIACHREGKGWEISVADNGIGIDPQYKEKIFKIFQRLHGDSEYQGTGIGLAICQRIAEFHGGSIRLDENYTTGSRFIVVFPAV